MKTFWKALLRKALPPGTLNRTRFAVFGLGDSTYAKFNAAARRLVMRLRQLGAVPLLPPALSDEQAGTGLLGALDDFLPSLWAALLALHPLPDGTVIDDAPEVPPPRWPVQVFSAKHAAESGVHPVDTTSPEFLSAPLFAAPTAALGAEERRTAPTAVVEMNERLTAADWDQAVHHISFKFDTPTDAAADYAPADVAHLWSTNAAVTDGSLRAIGLDPDAVATGVGAAPGPVTVRTLFRHILDCLSTPRRHFFQVLALFATAEEEREKLVELASPAGADLLYDYAHRERRTYLEVLSEFPSCRPPLVTLCSLIPLARPRAFSIASSPLAHPGRFQLCVAAVRYTTPLGRRKAGVCSNHLIALPVGTRVPFWITRGTFAVPTNPRAPMLLVGPGTGIAPMRAIAEHAAARAANEARTPAPAAASGAGRAVAAPSLSPPLATTVVFGCRHRAKDFHYAHQWRDMTASGAVAAVWTAFSRDGDGPGRHYVQHELRARRRDVVALLQAGARVYVAGAAGSMPRAVQEEVEAAVAEGARVSLEEAGRIVRRMQLKGLYTVEAWA